MTEMPPNIPRVKTETDFTSLKSLREVGIDTSFLETFERIDQENKSLGARLNDNANVIQDLVKEQKER